MTKLLIALATTVALVGPAHAKTYTYMCRMGHKLYPVTLTTPNEGDCSSPYSVCDLSGGTITWRGVTFRNVSGTQEDCKAKFTATRDGVTIELCTATQGSANLTVGKDTFECEMPESRGPRQLPKSMTGTWCYDQEMTKLNTGYEVYMRGSCADSEVIVVRVDGYTASSRRCTFDKVSSPIDREYWAWGHCVESAELGVRGRRVPMGGNGGLRFEQINNQQMWISELPPTGGPAR